ncbi:MAG: hypothetical protein II852_09620 [Bacteroidales bacterium]|nr:hypothetical protein [Bacteroidales bacterium]
MKRVNYFAFSAALMMAAACSEPLDEVADEAAPQNDAGILVTLSPEELDFLTELSNGTPKISVDSLTIFTNKTNYCNGENINTANTDCYIVCTLFLRK